jgi:uncharacterized GH25 family protein
MISGTACAQKNIGLSKVTLSTSDTDRGDDDQNFDAGETFYVHMKLTNDGSTNLTPSDDIDVEIDIDGTKYYDDTLHVSSNLAPGNTTYLVISSNSFNDEWNYNLAKYECKGSMEVEARISGDVDSDKNTAQLTIEEKKSDYSLRVSLTPDQPILDESLAIKVTDDGGDEVASANVKITELGSDDEWDKSDDNWKDKTDSDGEVTVILSKKLGSDAKGKFQLDAYKDGYCKETITFEISKKLILTGPEPAKPQVGKSFAIKVTTEGGSTLRFVVVIVSPGLHKATSDADGLAKFTINTAGTYTASAATTGYDDANPISFTVQDKPTLSVSLSSTTPKLGDTVSITVTSEGSVISGATVKVTLPDGTERSYTTSGSGTTSYVVQNPGYHTVDAIKSDYGSGTAGFTVANTLNIIIPDLTGKEAGDDVSITIQDNSGKPVYGASVSLVGTDVGGITDSSGVFTFKMPKTGSYTLRVTKEGYNAKDSPLKSSGRLSVKVSTPKAEIGERVKITIYDEETGLKVMGEIQVTKLDGTRTTVTKDEYDYVPQEAGVHNITVSKENYASASETLEVTPKSIVFDLEIEGDTLKITASSGGNPTANVTLKVTTPSGAEKEVVTDKDGVALLKADEAGEYSVSTKDASFESGEVKVTKKGLASLLWWIILALLVILFLILIIGVGIFHWHFRRKKGNYERDRKSSLD